MTGDANAFGGDLSGNLAVTAYRPTGGSLVNSTTAYIVSQRGSKVFKIHLDDSSEAVYTLKSVAPASLVAGECCIKVILDDSALAYVERFYNRTIHYVTSGGTAGTTPWTLSSEAAEDTVQSGKGVVDTI